jgi:hypothetical protein
MVTPERARSLAMLGIASAPQTARTVDTANSLLVFMPFSPEIRDHESEH